MFSPSQESGTSPEERSQFQRFGEETLFKLQIKKLAGFIPFGGLFFRPKFEKYDDAVKFYRCGGVCNPCNKITKCS